MGLIVTVLVSIACGVIANLLTALILSWIHKLNTRKKSSQSSKVDELI